MKSASKVLRLVVVASLVSCGDATRESASIAKVHQSVCGNIDDATQKVWLGLEPHCKPCHTSGGQAYFASAQAFQSLLVSNVSLVKPGAPDESELMKLLEGKGSGAFKAMPIGTQSYAEIIAAGGTGPSIEELRSWIQNLGQQSRHSKPDQNAPTVRRMSAEEIHRVLYQQLGLDFSDFFIEAPEYGSVMADNGAGDFDYAMQPIDAFPAPRRSSARERFSGLGGGSVVFGQLADRGPGPTFVLTLSQVAQRWCRIALSKPNNTALFPAGSTRATDEAAVKATIQRWSRRFHGSTLTPEKTNEMYQDVWVALSGDAEAAWVGLCASFIRHPKWIFY